MTDVELATMAQQLVINLDGLLDVLDVREGRGSPTRTSGALCASSNLDWLVQPNGDPITARTRKTPFDRQLSLCQSCGIQTECLDIALTENRKYGIWGGLMPSERNKIRRQHV